ncbi:MAG: carbohydrate binding family 9 domain-containing protein [Acidobacteria bacterium]|nr:carbohydrate binding family 9 domain-containing protein [Acidobacteriota bacterium]MYG74693.1 carbohydrate binding family 9 domain-containing protein [Acidobacteriota bacterium]
MSGSVSQRRRWCVLALGGLGVTSLPSGAGGQDVPVARASRARGPIEVDGRLDDDAWAGAGELGAFVQVDPAAGEPSHAPTSVRLLWDDAGLYIGAEMTEPEARTATRVEGLRRDFTYGTSDVFGVLLDGFGDGRFAMAFMTNPDGVQRDLLIFDGRDADEAWNGIWRVRTARIQSGWTVEIFIPWKTLRYGGIAGWRVNFIRETRAIQETSGWSPWHRGVEPWDMAFAGRLEGIAPPPPGVNAQIQPYLAGRAESIGSAPFRDPTSPGDAGIDLKWAMTPNTVLDLTWNMDFAQAEVDRQVVNLDRFSVFFPERRTFFLESAGLFHTGLNVIAPFYSRRIGLDSEGQPVPVTAGARVTHRSTKSSGGALLVRQEGVGSSDGTVFGVGRYVRNVGASGRLGGLVATRHDQGLPAGSSALNTVGVVDWFFRPTTNLFTRGKVSRSFTEGNGGDGWAGHVWVGNTAPWGYVGWLQEYVDPQWEPRSGFVFTKDVIVTSPAVRLDLRPAWLPRWARAYTPGLTLFLFNRASTGDFFSGFVSIRPLTLRLESGGEIGLSLRPEWQRFDGAFQPVPGIRVPADDYRFTRWTLSAEHDPSANVTGGVRYTTGPFYDGSLDKSEVSAKAVLSPHVVGFVSWEMNRFHDVGGSDGTTHLLTPELRLALNPRLELSGIWQYNTAVDASSVNVRVAWEFRPLSFLYVVYNDNASLDSALAPFPARRQLIVKGTWLWQP